MRTLGRPAETGHGARGRPDSWATIRSQPISRSVSVAAANATAPNRLGVPASSRSGRSAHAMSSRLTASTVPPPQCRGSAPSPSRRPTSAPLPNGAYSLCAESATKSRCAGSSCGRMSIGRCGASCAASTRILSSDGVDLCGQLVDGLDHAGHVGCTRHHQHRDPRVVAGEQPIEVVAIERAVGAGTHVHGARTATPRQIVGMVLHHRGQHDGIVVQWYCLGELVDRLRRVAS